MLFLKQSTVVDVVLGPFIDDTDGKTTEEALTLAQADLQLTKNGATAAQKNDTSSATHLYGGNYKVDLNATDTNTVGHLRLMCKETGALPVIADFYVLEEAIYDAVFGASAAGFDSNGRVDVGSVGGTAQTANDNGADINTLLTRIVGTLASGTHNPQSGDTYAQIGSAGAGLTAVPWNASWDSEVQSECTDALNAYDPPTNAEMEARTLVAASYFDPAADTVANVTTTANVTNEVTADMTKISGSATAADNLEASALGIVPGACEGTPTTTVIQTDLAENTNDHYIGRVIVFTSGNAAGEATDITDYTGATGTLTVTALVTAPAASDTFVIV